MSRVSAWAGNYDPNQRRYVTLAPDAYIKIKGDTALDTCAECGNKINFNDYVTNISTSASVDSAPGTANFELTIPDTDRTQFYQDGRFIIVPMMEIEIFAKGYYLIGGVPQYYKIFWGMTTQINQSWANGSTRISIGCKDILYWWDLTLTTINPAYLQSYGGTTGNYAFYQNAFAGANPYSVIIQLAQESMGDWSFTTGSLLAFIPEMGKESGQFGNYSLDLMTYWQNKFANIWNNLTIYGASGQAYTFPEDTRQLSPVAISAAIIAAEKKAAPVNAATRAVLVEADTVVAYKTVIGQAGQTSMYQPQQESKLSIARHVRDQLGYEFYCDTTGDIVFKPPFYNLNVLPNKPSSWIQDFEIISDDVTEDEAEVVTHLTASGTAFSGKVDYGVTTEFTATHTGVVDYHMARRYGWRRQDYQVEWAGDPKRLFFHLIDYLDRINSKRNFGSVSIPMRPELRLGFPVYIPKYDSFFYVSGISHNYSVGSTASTTLTLTAKRGKFVAPSNIGEIKVNEAAVAAKSTTQKGESKQTNSTQQSYTVKFPSSSSSAYQADPNGYQNSPKPIVIRDPKTGKVLGYPNVVMVYEKGVNEGDVRQLTSQQNEPATAVAQAKKGEGNIGAGKPNYQTQKNMVTQRLVQANSAATISKLRSNRYEVASNNAGYYNYAHDVGAKIKTLAIVTAKSYFNADIETDTKKADIKSKVDYITTQIGTFKDELKKHNADLLQANAVLEEQKKIKGNENVVKSSNEIVLSYNKDILKVQGIISTLTLQQRDLTNPPTGNFLIRPVSDEFGFELIGHYKYGRGLVIDTGQVQAKVDGSIVNKLNIQFSPSNGITSTNQAQGQSDTSENIAKKWEEISPEEWITGASFFGNSDPGSIKHNYSPTSVQTYTPSNISQTSNAIYVEADAIRRAQTLVDLGPSIDLSNLGIPNVQCACALSRGSWLTILPEGVIKKIVDKDIEGISKMDDKLTGKLDNVISNITSNGFFEALNAYMIRTFETNYKENANRINKYATTKTRARAAVNIASGNTENPSVPIFTQAASGSPAAVAVIENSPNQSFGLPNQYSINNNYSPNFTEVLQSGAFQNANGPLSPNVRVPGTETVTE